MTSITVVKPSIRHLFEPQTVAIVGASSNEAKIGYQVLDNIVKSGYKGKIFPVNPRGGTILGQRVYKTIEDIDSDIDIATICIPAKYVYEAIKLLPAKKCKFLSIITSGFSEVGNIDEELELVEYASDHGMRILGPNIFGIYSANASINATFGPAVKPGALAVVTQSGALGIAMLGKAESEGIGLSAIVSVGNKSDLDEADLLEYLRDDD
ncbi:MAG: CoA-binding protein, partial [Candidatus Heimdallarchaeota archaeon]|nr:CoA-binding protein [Candidatus Heimdallarchaeota archaeon]